MAASGQGSVNRSQTLARCRGSCRGIWQNSEWGIQKSRLDRRLDCAKGVDARFAGTLKASTRSIVGEVLLVRNRPSIGPHWAFIGHSLSHKRKREVHP